MRSRLRRSMHATVALVVALPIGCVSSTAPEWTFQMGEMVSFQHLTIDDLVIVPRMAQAGVPAIIRLSTFGSSTCTRGAGAGVRREGNVVLITPRDRVAVHGTACTRDLVSFPRDVAVTFPTSGDAEVHIRFLYEGDTLVLVRHVMVTS